MPDESFAPPQPIFRVAGIRSIEEQFLPQVPLMERAGAAAAQVAARSMPKRRGTVLVAAGPGNNGGDGFVLARLLRQAGHDVIVAFAGDEARLPADARAAFEAWRAAGGESMPDLPPNGEFALAVDALFGIGLQRPIVGRYADWIGRLNALRCPLLAVDIPSGLDADTGRVLGAAVRASHTATFLALKPGLLTLDGPDHCGELSVHDLGIDVVGIAAPEGLTVAPAMFANALAPRPRNSHKGLNGSVGILGGATGMVGAALLAGRAALRLGAGRVFVGLLDETALAVDPVQPELMLRGARAVIEEGIVTCLAIGPGLGQSEAALAMLRMAVTLPRPLILDADALNLVAAHPVLARQVARRTQPTLITPHPAEAARLLGGTAAGVQHDRVTSALRLAHELNACTVLKGCGSVIAFPDGRWLINTSGNPGMASAGMGDVLTGMAAALLAQGWGGGHALAGAVHLHGAAADALVAAGTGPVGLAAGELIDAARQLFNRLIAMNPEPGGRPA
jgi:hydroxyethylthiazole kinase-like uncharacterized protein yjeF